MNLHELKRRARELHGPGYLSRKWVRAVLWMRRQERPLWVLDPGSEPRSYFK